MRVAVSTQTIVTAGVSPVYTAIDANGVSFKNDGRKTFILINNPTASSITNITVQTPATVGGLGVEDLVVSVNAGVEKAIGPFPTDIYNQADGSVYVDSSLTTGIQIAVLQL